MNINENGEIVITGNHLVYIYGVMHFLYAFGTHYVWVWKTRQKAKEYSKLNKAPASICGRCMIKQSIPNFLFGFEWKILQVVSLSVIWIIKVLLGGTASMPFKIKFFRDPSSSFLPHASSWPAPTSTRR